MQQSSDTVRFLRYQPMLVTIEHMRKYAGMREPREGRLETDW